MAHVALLTALLVGPVSEQPPQTAIGSPSAADVRSDYLALMHQFADRKRPDPADIVPPLCDLHDRIAANATLSRADRKRFLHGVENRLAELHGRLMRQRRDASRAGGAPNAQADELTRLIETTVAPETWDVNGGRGTIRFWSQSPALVIRQTGEVHPQIGETLNALRK